MMFDVFENCLREKVEISDPDMVLIRAGCTERGLRQSILQEGEVWRINCFNISGCCRLCADR
jgi:hypothetical protein